MNVGGSDVSDWGSGQFFNALFPWYYVTKEIIPVMNQKFQEEKNPLSSLSEFNNFLGLWVIITLNPGYC